MKRPLRKRRSGRAGRAYGTPRVAIDTLEHFQEKWSPVFRREMRPCKASISRKSGVRFSVRKCDHAKRAFPGKVESGSSAVDHPSLLRECAVGGIAMELLNRVKAILLTPHVEWPVIARE